MDPVKINAFNKSKFVRGKQDLMEVKKGTILATYTDFQRLQYEMGYSEGRHFYLQWKSLKNTALARYQRSASTMIRQ